MVNRVKKGCLFEKRHDGNRPGRAARQKAAAFALGLSPGCACGKFRTVRVGIVVQRDSKLLHLVDTRRSTCSFTSLLYRWQEEADKNADNCNDDKEFDEREAAVAAYYLKMHSAFLL